MNKTVYNSKVLGTAGLTYMQTYDLTYRKLLWIMEIFLHLSSHVNVKVIFSKLCDNYKTHPMFNCYRAIAIK